MNQVIYEKIPIRNRGEYFSNTYCGYISVDDIVRHKDMFYIKRKAKVHHNPFKGDIKFTKAPSSTMMADAAILYIPTNLQHKWYEEDIDITQYHKARYVDLVPKKLTIWQRLDAFLFPT